MLRLFLNDGNRACQKAARMATNIRRQADIHRAAATCVTILEGSGRAPSKGDEALLAVLLDPEATALEQVRAAAQLTAAQLGREPDRYGGVDAVKKTFEELRRSEAGFVELEEHKGRLIDRDVAKAVCGQVASRAVQALDRFESKLAGQIEVWLGTREWVELGAEERSRRVRTWAQEQSRASRVEWAGEVERLIEAERSAE